MLDGKIKSRILEAQKNEITEHFIYARLSSLLKDREKAAILKQISEEELKHYELWKTFSAEDVAPDKGKVFFYVWLARLFGLTFGLKLMESGEDSAQDVFEKLKVISPQVDKVIADENAHENQLIGLIDEERLKYVSSVVLGLNDALVELTGALVGFTLALQNARLVSIVGLITGIAASLSMAASEYLSTRQEDTGKDPVKACIYTGIAYVGTVIVLVSPYFIFKNIYLALSLVLLAAVSIIYIFTYYISVAKELNFKKRFLEMAGISLGIAAINFCIGLAVRKVFGIDV